jgi:hypothetical protein
MARNRGEDINVAIGVAWYSEQDWTRLRLVCADPEEMDDSYAEWRAAAEKAIDDLRRQGGQTVERIDIDIDEFLHWCRLHGRRTDKAARAEFATHCLQVKRGRS